MTNIAVTEEETTHETTMYDRTEQSKVRTTYSHSPTV